MGIYNIFSKRQKEIRGETPDVYVYDTIPQQLRIQIIQIIQNTLGDSKQYDYHNKVFEAYKFIVETLRHEYGVFALTDTTYYDHLYIRELFDFILAEPNIEKTLDAIELSFQIIDIMTRDYFYLQFLKETADKKANEAIEELNSRFKEHGIGFIFIDRKIIRVDSELIHSQIVKPALVLLQEKRYAGAQAEFLKAHEFYRHGKTKEALSECLKALESTMKIICDKRKWLYGKGDTSKKLIDVCFKHDLIPKFWEQQFSALRSTLESGVPTARNKLSGHGQGSQIIKVPSYIAAYQLHMTAAAIVFLVESEKSL